MRELPREQEDFLDWRRSDPAAAAARDMPIQAEIDYLDWLDTRGREDEDRRVQLEWEREREAERDRGL